MAKCAACRKEISVPFWKFATLCPECKAAQVELNAKLQELTPVFIVTPCLVGLNVLVFCVMVASGASVMDPDTSQLIQWGASYGVLTLGPLPWRVVTSMFVHIGIIHLLFNMWCLWSLGRLAERLMGNRNFLLLYLLSGVGGSLLSLWLHPQLVSAGASGAIFGVAGGLIAILSMKKVQIPSTAMKQTFKSLLFFVGYNLIYGMKGGIDNAAHLGGLLGGLVLGVFFPSTVQEVASAPELSSTRETPESPRFKLAGAALACVLLFGFGFVRRAHGPAPRPEEMINLELFKLGKADRTNLQEAAKLVEAGQTDDGTIEKLKTVALHAPASSLAHIVLAEAYNQKKRDGEAIQEYHKAISVQPNYPPAHFELGLVLLHAGQNGQAVEEYRRGLPLDPNNAEAHNNLGVALERNGDAKGALEEYRTAHTLDPKEAIYADNFKRLSPQR